MRALRAELSKLASLPSAWIAATVGVLLPAGVASLTAQQTGDAIADRTATATGVDTGYHDLAFGVIGAIVLGVVALSTEYTTEGEESAGSRQIITSLTAVPSRTRLLLAKIAAVGLVVAVLAAAASAATFTGLGLLLGEHAPALDVDAAARIAGVVVYWVLTAWIALGLTVLTRSGVVPMAVLIANTSIVSVTFLLTRITSLANYLPDIAGLRMFIRDLDTGSDVAPLTGGLVMTIWVLALLTVAAVVFRRRDA